MIERNISHKIEPNYSTWQTIEYSYHYAKDVIARNVPGNFVECGVACGNNLAAMCKAGRHGIGYDSFEGIPWAGEHDEVQPGMRAKRMDKIGVLESSGITVHCEDDVMKNFERWNILNYTLVKGWFQDTVKYHEGAIAVLRLDGDLYESTLVCLKWLYRHLSKGGILIVDDWNLLGCRKAFDEYFKHIERPQLILDNGITYWMK